MNCNPLIEAARRALDAPPKATTPSAVARRLKRRTYTVEHNHGKPLRGSSGPAPLTVPWQVELPGGFLLVDVPARNVHECRKLAAQQLGKLPPGTRCRRMKREELAVVSAKENP